MFSLNTFPYKGYTFKLPLIIVFQNKFNHFNQIFIEKWFFIKVIVATVNVNVM